MTDFDELSGHLSAVAGELTDLSEQLQSTAAEAQSRNYRAADTDGLAEISVDGRPRVVELTLHPDALRSGPDTVDKLLTGLLNDALGQARSGTRKALFTVLPGPIRDEIEDASERPSR